MNISIIIPAFNEENGIVGLLASLQGLRGAGHEVLVIDGGSTDSTQSLAQPLCDKLIRTPKGRALQMNGGARQSAGDMLWFLHADSILPEETLDGLPALLEKTSWGHFDVRLSGKQGVYRVIESLMNLRSGLTGIATGDQAIFVRRDLFWKVGGFSEIPLMEDISLSKKLGRIMRPARSKLRIQTSSRRWEQSGVVSTVLLMWWLRLQYFIGVDPELLAKKYYG